MNRKALFLASLFSIVMCAPIAYADGVLGITSISAEKTYAQADGDFSHGWKWIFSVTVPSNEPVLKMKFGNWTGAGRTIPSADNVRFYSTQSSNASSTGNAIVVSVADTYGSVMNLLPNTNSAFDLSTSTAGRQIQITIEARIPTGAAGGSYTGSFGIQTLSDATSPVITLIGNASMTIERGASYTEQRATALDNIDGTIASSSVSVLGTVTTSSIGTYMISYGVSDTAGNAATSVVRTVLVQDTIAPTGSVSYSTTTSTNQNVTATLTPSESVIFLNTTGIATTTRSGTATTTFTQNGNFTFLFADVANNTGSTTATVENIDTVAPSLSSFSLNGVVADVVTNNLASSSPSIALTASEAVNWLTVRVEKQNDTSVYKLFQSGTLCEDGGITCTKVWNGSLSSGVLSDGTYRVRVHMKDTAGNETDGYISKVVILDTTAPTVTITGSVDMNIYIGASYTDAGATAVDARDGTVSVSSSGSVHANAVGDYTVTYTATDALGNTASATRTVHVVPVLVTSIIISGATTVVVGNDIQMSASISLSNATNKNITWSVFGVNGSASINASTGVLHGTGKGTVKVRATAQDNSGISSDFFFVNVDD